MKLGKVERYIHESLDGRKALLFMVVDPVDYESPKMAVKTAKSAAEGGADIVLIGGSTGAQGELLDDVTKSIKEKEVDLVTLDMPNADKAVKNAHKALKHGGFIFGYLPHMEQVRKFVSALEKKKFADIVVLESIVRDMLVREQGMRPSTKGVWHTAYLVFAQKQ